MSNTQSPEPEPRPESRGDTDGADGEVPEEKRIDVTPGQPVMFEVPANTNLTINVVNEKPQGCLSSLWSGVSCLGTGIFVLIVIAVIIGSISR
jgi:hypothetical protein